MACGGGVFVAGTALANAPPAPNYANASSWLALPGPQSVLNDVPPGSGLSNLQDTAKADVFYILPTTGTGNEIAAPNTPYDDPNAYAFAVQVGKNQATSFNGAGRIFAPLYRGIKNELWGAPLSSVQKPLDLAYSDAKRAFDYYLATYNQGRPIIFVSHSQGDIFVYRLLLEEFDGKPLARQLVAAYVIGQPLAANFFADYHQIGPCNNQTDTGCMIGWCTFGAGTTTAQVNSWAYDQYYWIPSQQAWGAPLPPFAPSDNPITWTHDGSVAPQSANMGSLPANLRYPAPPTMLNALIPGAVSAQGTPGATYVQPAPVPPGQFAISVNGVPFTSATPPFVYHYFDFNLFWMNIRSNARDRLNAYLAKNGAAYPLITSRSLQMELAAPPSRSR